MSDPVLVVLLRSEKCQHCDDLLKIWSQMIQSLLTIYPQLRFPIKTIDTIQFQYPPIYVKNNTINVNLFPKDLSQYIIWYPLIMLIPGESWDECNKKLGPYNPATLKNVQIMNGQYKNGVVTGEYKWNTHHINDFILWFKDALSKIKTKQTYLILTSR